ncbi:MAG: aldo/keto reductase [Candidatus Dormibacteria bacterium]
MELRRLGSSDLEVSVVGLGTNNFGRRLDRDRTAAVVHAALDAGINFFDTANIYGGGGDSERFLGTALAGRRDLAIVATKFGLPMPGEDEKLPRGTREYIFKAIDASLERLGMDHVDLYQIHTPDRVTPIEETLGALDDLVKAGKIRFAGCSNFDPSQLIEADHGAQAAGLARFVSVQNEYSWLHREPEAEVAATCDALDIGLIPFFPLASGVLTGKYRRGEAAPDGTRLAGRTDTDLLSDANFDIVERLGAFARDAGTTLLGVAIGGLASQPAVTSVISGATSVEQVRANAEAGAWRPSVTQLEEIRRLA